MRLTKEMKSNLINIIVNKTQSPSGLKLEKLADEVQQWIFDTNPLFKDFLKTYYENSPYTFREHIYVLHKGDRMAGIYLIAPRPLLTKILNDNSYNFFIKEGMEVQEDFKPLYDKLIQLAKEQYEYNETIKNLSDTIMSCTTDTALADMYPDFVKYFNKAGICTKAKASLPAKLGLPQALEKFGLQLESSKKESEPETVQEELVSLGHKVD